MAWELVCIWTIVIGILVWFCRDERRRQRDAAIARAARYYAQRRPLPAARPAPLPLPPRRSGGLSEEQHRAFAAMLGVTRAPGRPDGSEPAR